MKELLSENNSISSQRVVLLSVVVVILVKFLAFNVRALIGAADPVAFSQTDVWVIGLAAGIKALQKFGEKTKSTTP